MGELQQKRERKILLLMLLGFVGTGSGISVYLGGQALLDLAAPPDKRFSTGGGARVSVASLLLGLSQDNDADSAPPKRPNFFAGPTAFFVDSSVPRSAASAGAGVRRGVPAAGADGAKSAVISKREIPIPPASAGGKPRLAAAPFAGIGSSGKGSSSGGALAGMGAGSSGNNMLSVKASGAAAQNPSDGKAPRNKSFSALKNLAGEAFKSADTTSANSAKSGMDTAYGAVRSDTVVSYESRLAGLDVMNGAVASLKQSAPESLRVDAPKSLKVDNAASKQDPFNAALDKAVKNMDPTSGVINPASSGLSDTMSSAMGGGGASGSFSGSSEDGMLTGSMNQDIGVVDDSLDPAVQDSIEELDVYGQGGEYTQNPDGTVSVTINDNPPSEALLEQDGSVIAFSDGVTGETYVDGM
ncbi:MAG: hypothetical protein PHP45_00425 [Elusimicrobiales bacterium]|nr:hypothetical protein [Elusimicrobiales bacterium]